MAEQVIEEVDDLAIEEFRLGEVDHVGEQDRRRGELVGDRLRVDLQPVGDRARQDVEEQASPAPAPLLARSSCRRQSQRPRAVKTGVPTAMLRASIVVVNQTGPALGSVRGDPAVPRGTARRRTSGSPSGRR
jgi:hypothetical protein